VRTEEDEEEAEGEADDDAAAAAADDDDDGDHDEDAKDGLRASGRQEMATRCRPTTTASWIPARTAAAPSRGLACAG
jgi:hypothetical protein